MAVKGLIFHLFVQSLATFTIASSYQFNYFEQYALPFSCDPVKDCADGSAGDKVPDPNDCNNYYLCIEIEGSDTPFPSSNPVPCGTGSHFDQENGDCVAGVSCQNLCVNMCKTTCDEVGEHIFDPCDPMKFYVCTESGPPLVSNCPEKTPYFNGANCTNDEDDTCDNCTPFCSEINIQTIDPNDCRSYYLCLEEGIPSEDDHFECQDGQFFDPEIGTCVDEGRPCTSLCSCNIEETTTLLSSTVRPLTSTTELFSTEDFTTSTESHTQTAVPSIANTDTFKD